MSVNLQYKYNIIGNNIYSIVHCEQSSSVFQGIYLYVLPFTRFHETEMEY